MELVSKPDILLKKEQTEIRLGAITKVALGVYRVEVALKHKEKVYPESFSFILLNFEPKEKGEPLDCAGVIDQMTHNFVYEECFEKGNTLK